MNHYNFSGVRGINAKKLKRPISMKSALNLDKDMAMYSTYSFVDGNVGFDELESKQQKLKEKIKKLEAEKDKFKREKQQIESLIVEKNKFETKVKQQMDDKAKSDLMYEQKLQSLEAYVSELKNGYNELKKEYEISQDTDDYLQRIKAMENEMRLLKAQNLKLRKDKQQIHKKNEKMKDANDLLVELEALKSKNCKLTSENARMRKNGYNEQKILRNMEVELTTLKFKNSKLNNQIAKFSKEDEIKQAEYQTKIGELVNKLAEVDKISTKVSPERSLSFDVTLDRDGQICKLKQQNVRYTELLAKSRSMNRSERIRHKKKVTALKERIDELLKHQITENAKNETEKIQKMEQEIKGLSQKLAKVRVLKNKSDCDIQMLQEKVFKMRDIRKTCEHVKSENNALRKKCRGLQIELRAKLNTIENLGQKYPMSVQNLEHEMRKFADNLVKSDEEDDSKNPAFSFENV